jgi:hypothetical protein
LWDCDERLRLTSIQIPTINAATIPMTGDTSTATSRPYAELLQDQVEKGSLAAHDDGISGKLRAQGRARKETAMNPKVLFGSIAGVAVVLVGIGGTWVILNFDTLVAKALELGIKLAVQRGVQLTPETVKLLLELSGGAAGATAGAAGQAAASTGQRAGKARQAGTGAGRRVTQAARSAG